MNKPNQKRTLLTNFGEGSTVNKISKLFCLLALMGTAGASKAQRISIIKKNVSLESLLKDIEKQGNYAFLYKKGELHEFKEISVNLSNVTFEQAIKTLISNIGGLEYEMFGTLIVIKKTDPEQAPNLQALSQIPFQGQKKATIMGQIIDSSKKPVHRAFLEDRDGSTYTYTDMQGRFILNVGKSGVLSIARNGFENREIPYSITKDTSLNIVLATAPIMMDVVDVTADNVKANPTRFVDLKNRSYMNLGQVLQGTIPGLSLQAVNSSQIVPTGIDEYVQYVNGNQQYMKFVRKTIEEFYASVGETKGKLIIAQLLDGKELPDYKLHTTTVVTNAMVPQIRGANNFTGNMGGMLIVIDGFPQEGFPSDYPMMNVESIEVIKDPKELAKWGPSASGGAILIRTKSARAGKISVNYSSNFYYSATPRYSRNKLKLASTQQYLDYLMAVDSVFPQIQYSTGSLNISPAKRLLNDKNYSNISKEVFQQKWDSLGMLSNERQLQAFQNEGFRQNHSLNLSGGSKAYQFTFIGNYSNEYGPDISNKSNATGFSLNNKFNLLKGQMKIDWLINYSLDNSKSGYSFSATNTGLEPYQLLYDENGNYLYDYTTLSESANNLITKAGYLNHGVNLLQDARLNFSQAKSSQRRTKFDIKWEPIRGLKFNTNVYYDGKSTTNGNLYDGNSSYARQMVNTYGEYGINGVNFYLPFGDIYSENKQRKYEWNVRSSLLYEKSLGEDHHFSIGVGGGAASIGRKTPSYGTQYGYNRETKSGTPIFLPAIDPRGSINNMYGYLNSNNSTYTGSTSNVYPSNLLTKNIGDTTVNRNLNMNLTANYSYKDRLNLRAQYNGVFSPMYGQDDEKYSVLENYSAEAEYIVLKKISKWHINLGISSAYNSFKMPDMPPIYSNIRYMQYYWSNYGIWVNGLSPTQQQGQKSETYSQKMKISAFDDKIIANIGFNNQSVKGSLTTISNNSNLRQDTTQKNKFVSLDVEGHLRNKKLNLAGSYSKSPEGQDQWNAQFKYDIANESYFASTKISSLVVDAKLQTISPYQAMNLMMSTNVNPGNGFSSAVNSNFTLLPPKNINYEVHGLIGWRDDQYTLDLRYYNQKTSGVNNLVDVNADPATGVGSRVTYSSLINKGIEFFLKTDIIKNEKFGYNIIINGAYNKNIAETVPKTNFTPSSAYTRATREGYDISNLWSVNWAGLNSQGDPQIYDGSGNITATLDSISVASSLVYSGVTKAPWTGGFIQEGRLGSFFARAGITFNLGHVMRTFRPVLGNNQEQSELIDQRWRIPGDELITDIPRLEKSDGTSFRSFVSTNGTNSIVTADNIRFQELMLGYNLPLSNCKKLGLNAFTITIQAQNIAVWTRNKFHLDPTSIGSDGRVGLPLPRIYSCSINLGF
jgi:hypothetical protein